jgi:hypothetical protein
MALLDSEIRRIRKEVGINILTVNAEPWIGVTALFENVIQANATAGAITTSSTAVSATGGDPAFVTLTLASVTGFHAAPPDRVIVDVDAVQEAASVQSITGSTITIALALAHSGTYPVTVEGGESLIRDQLRRIITLGDQIITMAASAGVKKADEVEFHSAREAIITLGPVGALWRQREWERKELCELLGIIYPREVMSGGSAAVSAY